MLHNIRQIRKSCTAIELEAGTKHPDRPDYALMKREAEEIEFQAKTILKDIRQLTEF